MSQCFNGRIDQDTGTETKPVVLEVDDGKHILHMRNYLHTMILLYRPVTHGCARVLRCRSTAFIYLISLATLGSEQI